MDTPITPSEASAIVGLVQLIFWIWLISRISSATGSLSRIADNLQKIAEELRKNRTGSNS